MNNVIYGQLMKDRLMSNIPFSIAGITIHPGERKALELTEATLYSQTPLNIPIHIINGKESGPRAFIIAAVHGDEINGVEIIRRLLRHAALRKIRGTLIVIPVANIYGFMTLSRYLPDGRDLNRAFPGSKSGSMGARIANLYTQEIIRQCDFGIDLHTGNKHSENLPHVRTNLEVPGTNELAKAFNVPVIVNAKLRDGSIRQAASELNIPVLVYEGGEALRFNETAIRIGLRGVLNVLQSSEMIVIKKRISQNKITPRISYITSWVRSSESGILHAYNSLGNDVDEGEKIGTIANPFAKKETEIITHLGGIIIGKNTLPLVNEGDALFHIAQLKGLEDVTEEIVQLQNDANNNPDFDE